jgi:PadR family transcriptional regulator, regulatory protein AphA
LPPRHEVLLKLFFGRHARPGDLPRLIAAYQASAEAALARLEAVKAEVSGLPADDPDLVYWLLSMDFGMGTLAAIRTWCTTALATLTRMEKR